MLVFPHLAKGRYPVPGYATVFPMYESVHYALPGEVAPRRNRSALSQDGATERQASCNAPRAGSN